LPFGHETADADKYLTRRWACLGGLSLKADEIASAQMVVKPPLDQIFYRPVEELRLCARAVKGLKNADIFYLGDLVQRTKTEMLRIIDYGPVSFKKTMKTLAEMGLSLGMKLEGFKRPKRPA
jgi:DNA-directed RNA polymerase subunit alpha